MNGTFRGLIARTLVLATAMSLAACGGGGGGDSSPPIVSPPPPPPAPPPPPVVNVNIAYSTLTLEISVQPEFVPPEKRSFWQELGNTFSGSLKSCPDSS